MTISFVLDFSFQSERIEKEKRIMNWEKIFTKVMVCLLYLFLMEIIFLSTNSNCKIVIMRLTSVFQRIFRYFLCRALKVMVTDGSF